MKRTIFAETIEELNVKIEIDKLHGWDVKKEGGYAGTFWVIMEKERNNGLIFHSVPRIIECRVCGDLFETSNPRKKCCSPKCNSKRSRMYEK